jgi:hypothetical protein
LRFAARGFKAVPITGFRLGRMFLSHAAEFALASRRRVE